MNLINYKKSVILISVSLIVTVIILFLIQNLIILPKIKGRCENIISELMGYSVNIGKINGGMYQGISLSDITSDNDALRCKSISAEIDFSSFMWLNFALESLSFDQLYINHYDIYSLVEKLSHSTEKSSFYPVNYINVTNSSIIYNDNKINLNFLIKSPSKESLLIIDSIRYLDKEDNVIYGSSGININLDLNNNISSQLIKIIDIDNKEYKVEELKFNYDESSFEFRLSYLKSIFTVQSQFKFINEYINFLNITIQDSEGYLKVGGDAEYSIQGGTYKGEFYIDSTYLDDYALDILNLSLTGNNELSIFKLSCNNSSFYRDSPFNLDAGFKYHHTSKSFIFDDPFVIKSEKYSGNIEILNFTSFTDNKFSVSLSFKEVDLSKINTSLGGGTLINQFPVLSGDIMATIHNNNNALYYTGKLNIKNTDMHNFNINNTSCEFAYNKTQPSYNLSCDISEIYYLKTLLYNSVDLTFDSDSGIHIDSNSEDNHISADINFQDQIFHINDLSIKVFGKEYYVQPNQINTKNYTDYNIKDLHMYINESKLLLNGDYNSEGIKGSIIMDGLILNDLFDNVKGLVDGIIIYDNTQLSDSLYVNIAIDTFRTEIFNTDNMKLEMSGSGNIYNIKNISSIYNGNKSYLHGSFRLEDINKFPKILSDAKDINFNVDINNFEISSLSKYYYPKYSLRALTSFNGLIKGSATSPTVSGDILAKNLHYRDQRIESIHANISVNNNGVKIDDMNIIFDKNSINIDGYLPFSVGEDYDLHLKGKLHSIQLYNYISHVDSINGNMNFKVNVDGEYPNPIKGGNIEIKNSTVHLNQIDNPVLNFNTKVNIENNIILISNATCSLPNTKKSNGLFSSAEEDKNNVNNININGSIDIEDTYNPDFNISFKGKDIYIESTYNQIQGMVDADLNIVGKDSIAISGRIRPVDNSFTIYELLSPISESFEESSRKYSISYNVHFPMDETINVNTDDINLTLDGDVDIIKSFSDNSYQLIGRVNVIDGRFNFNGNNFKETNGYILFNPDDETYIDIKSIATVIDEEINISFIGSLDEPTIILDSSSGKYSHSDILKMLAFKNSDDNLSNQDISSFLTNYIKNELEKNIVRYSNLDEFHVVSGNSISGNVNNINISMGKQLSNNLYMNLTYDVNNNNFSNYELSYRVNKNISIVGERNDDESWGLKYRFKYQY